MPPNKSNDGNGANLGFEIELWRAADALRSNMDAAEYKHVVLGLIFLKRIYIALSSPSIDKERIIGRVRRGGLGVREGKIALRWQRSLENRAWFARRSTNFWILDNSASNRTSPPLLASGHDGRLDFLDQTTFPEMKTSLASLPQ
jgi:predicted ABC-type ATPase